MSDSTLRLTFDNLRIRVAEYLGVAYYGANGDGAAQLPVDTHDLDLVGRLVNDGYARFLTDHEKGWHFLTVPISITFGTGTISSDDARYYAPDDFYGIVLSPFTYDEDGPRQRIDMVTEAQIRLLQAGNGDSTGNPSVFAVRPLDVTPSTTTQRWEIIFWPTPSGTETVTSVYKRFPNALSSTSDVSVAGYQHDRTVLAAALAEAELQRNDTAGPREAAYQMALARSRKIDDRSRSIRVADFGDRSEDGSVARRPSNFYGVDTYNGVTLNHNSNGPRRIGNGIVRLSDRLARRPE